MQSGMQLGLCCQLRQGSCLDTFLHVCATDFETNSKLRLQPLLSPTHSTRLEKVARPIIDWELQEVRAASALDAEEVERTNRQLLAELGFGRLDALLEDLQEDESSAKLRQTTKRDTQLAGETT